MPPDSFVHDVLSGRFNIINTFLGLWMIASAWMFSAGFVVLIYPDDPWWVLMLYGIGGLASGITLLVVHQKIREMKK